MKLRRHALNSDGLMSYTYRDATEADLPPPGLPGQRSGQFPFFLPATSSSASNDPMTQYFGIDWLAMCLTFTAIYLLGNKSRHGFVIMMVGNLCWSTIGVWAQSYAMVIANLGFFAMNVRGYMKWAPGERAKDAAQSS